MPMREPSLEAVCCLISLRQRRPVEEVVLVLPPWDAPHHCGAIEALASPLAVSLEVPLESAIGSAIGSAIRSHFGSRQRLY